MTTDLDRMIRETLVHLADEGRPVNLAAAALRQRRQIVARRRALTSAAAVVAVAALVVPFAVFGGLHGRDLPFAIGEQTDPPSTTAQAEPSVHPTPDLDHAVTLPGNWIMAAARAAKGGTLVYDRAHRRYRTIGYSGAVPAPRGTLVAVQRNGTGGRGVGLLDLSTDQVRWIAGPAVVTTGMDWSSDGSRLVYAGRNGAGSAVRAVVVDTATGTARQLPAGIDCVEACAPHWLPGDTLIGFNERGADGGWNVHVYEADSGAPARSFAVPGPVLSSHAWSPDGRYLVAGPMDGSATSIVEISSGRTVTVLRATRAGSAKQPRSSAPASARPGTSGGARGTPTATAPGVGGGPSPAAVYWSAADRVLCVAGQAVTQYSLDGAPRDVFPLPGGMSATDTYDIILTPIG